MIAYFGELKTAISNNPVNGSYLGPPRHTRTEPWVSRQRFRPWHWITH